MKLRSLYLALFAPLLALQLLALPGCVGSRTLDPSGVYEADQILFTTDQVIDSGFTALHAFVSTEATHRAGLSQWPEVKRAADYVRANVKQWRDDIFLARDAYQAATTEANRSQLERALAVVRSALATYATLQQRHALLKSTP